MSNQSVFVKIVIWFMVFLMSVGFAALVITPFMGNGLFGGGDGRGATEELLEEARADVRSNKCTADKVPAAKQETCRDAFMQLGSAYQTLAYPSDDTATELPKDSKRNLERAGDAYRAAYELDTKNEDAAKQYGAYLRDQGKYDQSITIWQALVKANPSTEDYLLQLAAAQSQGGKLDPAIATYTSFIKKFPDSGQLDSIREEINNLKQQKKDQAAQAASGGGLGGATPITVG